ncbi:MAG: hypothetical protein RJB66_541 [Pseudomonadota bacterium]|jgi:nucleotide-binding universal stress UspA family protein
MKILWALEPFYQKKKKLRELFAFLHLFAKEKKAIDIGYAVTRYESELHLAFEVPPEERPSVDPRHLMKQSLLSAKIKVQEEQVHVVEASNPSLTKAVDSLLSLAKEKKSELLVFYSHNKKGLSRFLLGSFAETAIHRSKINLLIVHPKNPLPKRLKQIFFACDLGPQTQKHLSSVLKLAKEHKAQVTVFHAAPVTYRWSLDESSPEILKERRKIEKIKASIEEQARRYSVSCSVVVKSEFLSTSKLCLKAANKIKADLLVVAAKSSAVKALMGGSVTRQIIRGSKQPIFVLKDHT